MSIYDSPLWLSDLDKSINSLPFLRDLNGKTVLITGCTGLIGSALTDLLIRWDLAFGGSVNILAAGRDERKVLGRFSHCVPHDRFSFIPYDSASSVIQSVPDCDYLVHTAGNAIPGLISKEPVETMLSAFLGIRGLLENVRVRGHGRVLFVSSSEVYGTVTGSSPIKADEYGYVDIMSVRSSYPQGKRAAETLCASYAKEYGVDSVIARPGHIYGPTASPSDGRVSSAWAYAAAEGRDIVMKSDGAQLRSYCYCLDCACALITILLLGEKCRAYNIADPHSVKSIRDIAVMLADFSGTELRIELPSEEEKKRFNPMENSSLDPSELIALGWKPVFSIETGFRHTCKIIRDIKAAE